MSSSVLPSDILAECNAVGDAITALQEAWPAEVRRNVSRHSDYFELPYWFLPAFPSLSPKLIRPLSAFCRLFASAIFVQDSLFDGHAKNEEVALGSLYLLSAPFDAYHQMHQVLTHESPFWTRLRTLLAAHLQACLLERSFRLGSKPWQEYTESVALHIAADKHGLSKSVIAGLCAMEGDERLFTPLCQALDDYNLACQMWDDLSDWKADLRDQHPSLLLRRIFHERPPRWTEHEFNEQIAPIGRSIYYGGHARDLLQAALASLQSASSIQNLTPTIPFVRAIQGMHKKCADLLNDIETITRRNLERRAHTPSYNHLVPEAQHPWEPLILDALRYVLRQAQLGFGEARSLYRYPAELGLSIGDAWQYGDIFERALITDILCDANLFLEGALAPLIQSETDYLIGRRLQHGIGGWRYFPELPELPPDTDDLAQVLCALIRAGRTQEAHEHGELPLSVLLSDGWHPDGSFNTWIVPRHPRSPEQERQADYVARHWGNGPHCDVVANMLHTLWLYDAKRFQDLIQQGLRYLAGRWSPEGTLPSRWYHGPYYALYLGLRLCSAIPNPSILEPHRQNALAFIRQHQYPDGGFGEDHSDPLNTAFALLGLVYAQDPIPEDIERIRRALHYLWTSREQDGAFPACRFFFVGPGLSYKSRTMTTAFVLKALLALRACPSTKDLLTQVYPQPEQGTPPEHP